MLRSVVNRDLPGMAFRATPPNSLVRLMLEVFRQEWGIEVISPLLRDFRLLIGEGLTR
jgi:hypothetical protein